MATLPGMAAEVPGDATSCDATSPGSLGGLTPAHPTPNATPRARTGRFTFLVLQQGQGHGHIFGASHQGRSDRGTGHADESRKEN